LFRDRGHRGNSNSRSRGSNSNSRARRSNSNNRGHPGNSNSRARRSDSNSRGHSSNPNNRGRRNSSTVAAGLVCHHAIDRTRCYAIPYYAKNRRQAGRFGSNFCNWCETALFASPPNPSF
jgi:hypothetical protein